MLHPLRAASPDSRVGGLLRGLVACKAVLDLTLELSQHGFAGGQSFLHALSVYSMALMFRWYIQWIQDLRDFRGLLKFVSYLRSLPEQKHCIYLNVSE
jgi:hypothetical protein